MDYSPQFFRSTSPFVTGVGGEGSNQTMIILFWCCTSILSSCLRVLYTDEYDIITLTLLLYILRHAFKEIALKVNMGKSSLNFPHAEQHFLIVCHYCSQPLTGQTESPRETKLSSTSQDHQSIAYALPRHLLHLKSSSSLTGISEHLLWTQNEHPLQNIEF